MSVISIFLSKEIRDAQRNKYLLPIYLILPPIAIGLSVAAAFMAPTMMKVDPNDPVVQAIIRIVGLSPEFAGMSIEEAFTRFLLRNTLAFYLLLPVGLSAATAAFSIVAEKQQRTLEPILATPITDLEFLIGKLLASLVPSIILTWAAALLAALVVNIITWGTYSTPLLPDRFWAIAVFVLAPLLGSASVLAAMRFSAKMTDPQSANQFTGLIIVPTFMIGIGIFGKLLTVSMFAIGVACLVTLLLALFLLRLNLKKFQREEILTKWK